MATKHDLILEYIESLPVGNRISVRSIAKELSVSEGTAYRAIKDAENVGLVSTIQRVGTIRIERKLKKHIERLTFGEVVRIIDDRREQSRSAKACFRGWCSSTHHRWF